jgi:hypothetical protein
LRGADRRGTLIRFAPAPYGRGGGFGARLEAELGQDAADVVLDGSDAEDEAFGDLAVGQAGREELEDLVLSFGEGAVPARSAAQSAYELGRLVGVARRAEAVEGGECEPGFAER